MDQIFLSIVNSNFSKEGSEVICNEYGFTYYPIIAKAAGCKLSLQDLKIKVSCDNIIRYNEAHKNNFHS